MKETHWYSGNRWVTSEGVGDAFGTLTNKLSFKPCLANSGPPISADACFPSCCMLN